MPEPLRQFSVPTSEGAFRLDFAWPLRRVAVEIDGAAAHASREALSRDLRRQNRLLLSMVPAGWAFLRFTWDDLVDPRFAGQVVDKLREAWVIGLNQASSGHSRPLERPTFHRGDRSGPQERTSLTLVQRNRRFRARPGHNGTTFAVFGTGRLHFTPASRL